VDHIDPQHKAIVEACWPLVDSEAQVVWWRVMLDGDGDTHHFRIPDDHPAAVEYDRLTQGGTFQSLCKKHHRGETRDRKNSIEPPRAVASTAVFEDPALNDLFWTTCSGDVKD